MAKVVCETNGPAGVSLASLTGGTIFTFPKVNPPNVHFYMKLYDAQNLSAHLYIHVANGCVYRGTADILVIPYPNSEVHIKD